MLDHFGVNVPDLAAAKVYYDALMPLLAFEPFFVTHEQFSYQPVGGKAGTRVFFYASATPTHVDPSGSGVNHLAFYVKTRAEVRAVHEWVLSVKGEVVIAPRVFPEYHEQYYGVFWHDPFGFLLEAVCHKDTDST